MWNKDKFIKDLVDALKYETEDTELNLNLDFMTSVVSQNIENCKTFIEEIKDKSYDFNGYIRDEDDNMGYTNGKIRILVCREDVNSEDYDIYDYEDYVYWITFGFDERHWGYCECSPSDENYSYKHGCCGMGCDFTAPTFSITKEINYGTGSWNGYECDLWEYLDRDKGEDVIKKEELEAKKRRLQSIIESAQEELLSIK